MLIIHLGLVAIGFIWFDPFRERFRNFDYPSLNWYQQPTDRVPAFWMRQQPAIRGNFWSMKRLRTGPLQTLLGVVLLAFSIVIVVAGCFRGEGRIALAITGGLLVIATIYWVAFIREESAGAVYRLFGYNLTRKVHGVDDYPHDPKRICHWCFVLKAAHRHPHDSYESYNGLDVRGRQYPRVLYTIFSDGSKPGYLIQSWSDLGLAIKGLFTTAGKEPEAETALTRIENRNTRE